jgi:hypothetical protein
MTKKTKTKEKVMTVQFPKPPAPRSTSGIINSLISLQTTEGWQVITGILNDNIKFLEQAILESRDPLTKEMLTAEQVDLLRVKRSLNIDLRDTPQNYIKVLEKTDEVDEEYDPYFKTNEDIKRSERPLKTK